MARPRRQPEPEDELEFRDPPPRRSTSTSNWVGRLTPLLKHRGRWAKIKTMDSPEQANSARGNLMKRNVLIPEPDHDWSFSARGCEVFAIYRGPKAKDQKPRPAGTKRGAPRRAPSVKRTTSRRAGR